MSIEGGCAGVDWAPLDGIASDSLWLRPLGIISGRAAADATACGQARTLAGLGAGFTLVAALGLRADRRPVSVIARIAELEAWLCKEGARFAERARQQLDSLSSPRTPWAGFAFDRPMVMGVLNVTPDSFSDGGQ